MESFLLSAIFVGLLFYLGIRILFQIHDRRKRSTDSLFFVEESHRKKTKSPNFIVQVIYNLSKVFYKLLPFLAKIAIRKSEESKHLLEDKIEKAGKPFGFDANEFNKLKVFAGILFFFLLFIVATGNQNPKFYYYAVAFGLIGFVYPDFFITGLLQQRAKKISLELPDAMDFISLCLAAGMNFQLAVEEYVKRNQTLLSDEFDVFINDVQVGIHRVDAFEHLLDRNESPEFRSFLSAVIQGEQLGTPLRPVIMNQAEELRAKRRGNVEKSIATAGTKMLFPLIMFILPAMLMIILGSVLLPAQNKKEAGIALTSQNYIYYQVTPGVEIYINEQKYPVYAFRVVKDPLTAESQLQYTEGAIVTEDQKYYMESFFRKEHISSAWFTRLDLPEGEMARYYISIIASNGERASDFIVKKYVHLTVDDFNEQGIFETDQMKTSIQGTFTPGMNLKLMLYNQELLGNVNTMTGEFDFQDISLNNRNNPIQFILSDSLGLSQTITKTIKYTGIYVSVAFTNEKTINPYGRLTGSSSPGTLVKIYKQEGNVTTFVQSIAVGDTGSIDEMIPIEPGINNFQMYTEDRTKVVSPKINASITRSLIP